MFLAGPHCYWNYRDTISVTIAPLNRNENLATIKLYGILPTEPLNMKVTIHASALLPTPSGNRTSSIEKEYIKNLDEYNAILEQEVEAQQNGASPEGSARPNKSGNVNQYDKGSSKLMEDSINAASDYAPNHFTFGSTEDVLRVMGYPTSLSDSETYTTLWYDNDHVQFKLGSIKRYPNRVGMLNVRVANYWI